MMKKGLGKGLGALISSANQENEELPVRELKINEIEPNLEQPRKKFDQEKLTALAESIKHHGIIQPIVVQKDEGTYKIIAGERRWRAARIAGLDVVPVVVKDVARDEIMEMALIENLQREDLNAIEEALAYEKLIKEYRMTQEEIAESVGKSRPSVANSLRLLVLSDEVKQLVIEDKISGGHARTLLAIDDEKKQLDTANAIIEKELSVRETEALVKNELKSKPSEPKPVKNAEVYADIEETLKNAFGTKVKLLPKKDKGKIMIEYYSGEELERILELINSIKK